MTKQLVVQLARFGDIMQTKRLLLSLLQKGQVHLCVDATLADLAALVYPQVHIHAVPAHAHTAATVLTKGHTVFAALQREQFDAVYILNHAGLSQAMATLFAPEIVRGYRIENGQPLQSNWVRLAFRWIRQRQYAPLNLVDYWAWLAPEPISPALVNPVARGGGKGLGVVLAGQHQRRSLPEASLAQIIQATVTSMDMPEIFLFGTQKEAPAARRLLNLLPAKIGARCVNLVGKTNWQQLQEALTDLDMLLSPDTGTIHLAAHLGIPVQGMYLSSAWAFETGPYGLGHKVWQTLEPCSPCTESQTCHRQVQCTTAYTQPAFLSALQQKRNSKHALQGLTLLEPGFDTLGQTWHAALGMLPDPYTEQRSQLRSLLAEYQRLDFASQGAPAETLYQETDWILPQQAP